MSSKVRQQAISPKQSFLVQAPAGSGKTELLTQRILALLAVAQEPEEIMALTFTRKAAAEMRARVLESLHMSKPDDKESHRMGTWLLAEKVLQRSHERQWQLLENPNRLRMMTLDSLTSMLARQLPLLSGLGDMPRPSEHAGAMYQQAAENTLNHAARHYRTAVESLLLHQDHNTTAVITLIANMLQNREQWLKYIAKYARDTQGLRDLLEHNLAYYMEHQLQQCDASMPIEYKQALPALMRFAAEHGGSELWKIEAWPEPDIECLSMWKNIADFLLTASGTLRKTVTKSQGFPADAKVEKSAVLDIFSHLSDISELSEQWHDIRKMPDSPHFSDTQWQVLQALFTLLPLASNELKNIFTQQGSADFTEISLRALDALSDEQGRPSDVLLKLDYRIQHILVDEFQDTSELQIELLRCLTAGWQEEDGRSLFMVGDPMQSIYRFRKAEVGLFLEAAKNNVDLPEVLPCSLQRNFRSSPSIVHWVNRAFAQIFPTQADAMRGAVCHAQAEAARDHEGNVHLHLQTGEDAQAEAMSILDIIRQSTPQKQRIGILARTRKHLHTIMPTLEKAGIAFRAIKILPLAEQAEVRTLRALTRALLHPADKASWAALLRSPCCGLNNQALFDVLGSHMPLPVWERLHDAALLSSLQPDTRLRVEHLTHALAPCMASVGHIAVRDCIETAWLRLGMPHLLKGSAHTNVETVLQLLDSLEAEHIAGSIHFKHFDERLEFLYAAPNSNPDAAMVELMTIHGAKGLQWDVVVLPGMGKSSGRNDAPLMAFTEAPVQGEGLFLLSPKAQTRSKDKLFSFIQNIEKNKDLHEQHRQLYVACTRAESQLHIFGHVSEKEGRAKKGSFLHTLLEHDEACFGAHIIQLEKLEPDHTSVGKKLQRMRDIPAAIAAYPSVDSERKDETVFAWAGLEAAPVGNVLHAIFEQIAKIGVEQWRTENNNQSMRRLLMQEGLSGEILETALHRCQVGLDNTLNSQRGRWILSNKHQHAHCEWAISHLNLNSSNTCHLSHYIIDRSFEDDDGIRWIIDYKTASHEGGDIEHFLDEECQRHQSQLQRYALALQAMGHHNLRLALYFPMLDTWREWEAFSKDASNKDKS
ncbi:UvrD-helicase domain-containing protein [bacterium AH-315-G11]|nr:UvrD-helicase domain-containing protein [bacterium AH-315-G11]